MFCLALGGAALVVDHPAVLAGLLAAVIAIGALAGLARRMLTIALLSLPLVLMVGLINAFLSRQGETVVWRFGTLPVVGRVDVTAEALAWSGTLVLRVWALVLVAALFSACVDQDSLIRLMRRRSSRFGLAVGIAARLAGLLASDGRRMAQARRTLDPTMAAGRGALVEAIALGALDRAVDAAAALELRGLGDSPCLSPPEYSPWSRHDKAFLVSSSLLCCLVTAALAADWVGFTAGAKVEATGGSAPWIVSLLLLAVIVAPMLDRRGVAR